MIISQHDLPSAYNREIGRAIVKWAYLENQLQKCVFILMGVDDVVGRVTVREPRVPDRIALIEEIAFLRGLPLKASTLKTLKKDVGTVFEFRNMLAHNLWVKLPDRRGWHIRQVKGNLSPEIKATGFAQKRKFSPEATPVSLDDLKALTAGIETLIRNTSELEAALVELVAQQLSEQSAPLPHDKSL